VKYDRLKCEQNRAFVNFENDKNSQAESIFQILNSGSELSISFPHRQGWTFSLEFYQQLDDAPLDNHEGHRIKNIYFTLNLGDPK
jgi:hypothetical protein